MIRLEQRLPMAALAGVGSYGIVFHTKIARSSRRCLQLHDSKRRVRASGIFDSHRPLHPQASSGNVGTRHLGQPTFKFRGGVPTSYERALDIGKERR